MFEGLQCLCGPVVLGLFDKIPVKIGGLGQKEDLEARWLDGTVKDGSLPRDQRSD